LKKIKGGVNRLREQACLATKGNLGSLSWFPFKMKSFKKDKEHKTKMSIEGCWDIIQAYFDQHGLVRQQLDSYNDLVVNIIPSMIREIPEITVENATHKYTFTISNGMVLPPQLREFEGDKNTLVTPMMARLRQLTYQGPLFVDLKSDSTDLKTGLTTSKTSKVILAQIPVMLRSEICHLSKKTAAERIAMQECEFDEGGYFIIKGTERVIIGQEKRANNMVDVFENTKKGIVTAEIRSFLEGSNRAATQLQLNYCHSNKRNKPTDFTIRVMLPNCTKDVPFFVVLLALGIKDLLPCTSHLPDSIIETCSEEAWAVKTEEEAQSFICRKAGMLTATEEAVVDLLNKDLLPHLKTVKRDQNGTVSEEQESDDKVRLKKANFIIYMAEKLCNTVKGKRDFDDRDHFGLKRVDLAGPMLGSLFRVSLNRLVKQLKVEIEKKVATRKTVNIEGDIDHALIGRDLCYTLSTGNWGVNRQKITKTGTTQALQRLTYVATLSNIRRFVAPMAKESKMAKPRLLHTTSLGRACLTGETKIMCSDGFTYKAIKDIKDGDWVQTVNSEDLSCEVSAIHSWFIKTQQEVFKIKTISGKTIRATKDHPFLIKKDEGFVKTELQNIQIGDKIICLENGIFMAVPIESITFDGIEDVYDFTTFSSNHSFIANGFWSSNCPAETPEGHSCGLVKNMCLLTHVSLSVKFDTIPIITTYCDIIPCNKDDFKLLVSGNWIGNVIDEVSCLQTLRQMRTQGLLPFDVGICINRVDKEIKVNTDMGRACRPLFRVVNNNHLFTTDHLEALKNTSLPWTYLIHQGVIEYIDALEEEDCLIAMTMDDIIKKPTYNFTHLEIHPSLMLSISASTIPFSDHNQAPRNVYQCLDPNTPVLMDNQEWKCIKDIKVGEFVQTFDPKTMEISNSKVINQYVKPTEKRIIRISTSSGRSLVCTEDHPLICYNQLTKTTEWKQAKDCLNNLIGIYPSQKVLENNGNLESNTIIQARMFGYLLTKKIEYNCIDFESISSASTFVQDCKILGFNEIFASSVDGVFKVNISTSLLMLMKSLESGIKTQIPDWIMNGPKTVKREFLAGFQGGSSKKIDLNNQQIELQCELSILPQIEILFKELGIFVSYNQPLIKIIWSQENIINYFETVGFRYNFSKIKDSNIFIEYLRSTQRHDLEIQKWLETVKVIESSLFISVTNIEEVENREIADITIESDNHSFIANNFCVHNSSQMKQAMGVYSLNYNTRMDTSGHVLFYTQKPLVSTKHQQVTRLDEMPSGQNAIVAIACYSG
jgi:DNA-directed RNA polymerase beta subunit